MTKDKKINLLLIEDQPDDAFLLIEALKRVPNVTMDFKIDHVPRLATGLEYLDENDYDLVLLDLSLPDGFGLDTFLRVHQHIPHLPIVVLSGLDDEDLAIKAVQEGAQDYLVKGSIISEQLIARSLLYSIERKQIEQALIASEKRFRTMIEKSGDGVVITSLDGVIQYVNPTAVVMFDQPPKELIGKPFDLPIEADRREYEIASERGEASVYVEIHNVQIEWEGQEVVLSTLRDITDRKRAEMQLQYLATHDVLTDLPNRALFYDILRLAISHAKRTKSKIAVMFFDLDGFKKVNDTYGHEVGDWLLRQVADRLKGVMRASDTIARLGGDEFTFIVIDVHGEEGVKTVIHRIQEAFNQPFSLPGLEDKLCVSGTIGISFFPDQGDKPDVLVKRADKAMYEIKHQDTGGFKFSK